MLDQGEVGVARETRRGKRNREGRGTGFIEGTEGIQEVDEYELVIE